VLEDSAAMPDCRALTLLADEMGVRLGLQTVEAARAELAELGSWDGVRADLPDVHAAEPPHPERGEAVLASWRMLLDSGRLQDGEPHLAGTGRRPVVRLSPATAADLGAGEDDPVTVLGPRGRVTLPLSISDMPDRVVWLPGNSPGSHVHADLGASAGSVVSISRGGAA
jgi:NADH-quinone oxidoreductase subunit G